MKWTLPLLLAAAPLLAVPPNTNLDEAAVPPYTLPDPLVCADGTPVADAAAWRARRRPELLETFAREVYGRTLLGRPEALRFVVRDTQPAARGGLATRLRVGVLFEGREDGRQMELLVYLPNRVQGPAPLFLGLNFGGNWTITDEPDIPLARHATMPLRPTATPPPAKPPADNRGAQSPLWQLDLALERGYGVATAAYGEIEPDANDNWKTGPRGLASEPGPGDWGCLGAWAWGLSRAMDYLETNPRVDARRVVLTGFSRLGKASLWAGAQDERFAIVVSNCSGAGGAALGRRIFGETVAHMTNNFRRWFCANHARYAGNEAACPVDQHELLALIAPRPLLVLSATEDQWADPKGEFLSTVGATSVYRLLGAEGMSQTNWPAAGTFVNSRVGYYLRTGKHDVTAEDWRIMLDFADRRLPRPAGAPAAAPAP